MPESNKSDVILRQWEMLRLVPPCERPGRSAQELVDALEVRGFRVTRRTVEHDLEKLRQSMPLDVDVQVRPQRWRKLKTAESLPLSSSMRCVRSAGTGASSRGWISRAWRSPKPWRSS